jgi:DNA-binding CsgD family transcriptional regulator
VVDTADVDLALRCLDCAMYAGSSEEWVHVTDRPTPSIRADSAPGREGHDASVEGSGVTTVGNASGLSGLLALERRARAGSDGGRWPERVADSGPDAAIAKLSGAECRVALLAARGHTNRVISVKLSVTVSTVEQHLTRVYRKLNIQDRRELWLLSEWPTPAIPAQRSALREEKKS